MKQDTLDFVQKVFDFHQTKIVTFSKGVCHDCKQPIKIEIEAELDGSLEVRGGAIYPKKNQFLQYDLFYKCDKCFDQDPILKNYQTCEVYSRTVGYLRPASNANKGKLAEINDRKMFDLGGFINND